MKEEFKDQLINKLVYGIIAISITYCVCGTIMIASMWHSYFATDYGYSEQDISNVNTNTINEE